MFDQVPVRVWLLIGLAAFAWSPAAYVYRHIAHAPSRRDITRPAEDLGWRTSAHLVRSLSILAAIIAVGLFIFTPAAEQLARSPRFFPVLVACFGAWALFRSLKGFRAGRIQPFVKGFDATYERGTQPKRFWASLAWNACLGCLCLWLAHQMNEQATADLCHDAGSAHSPGDSLSACNKLLAEADGSQEDMAELITARGVALHQMGNYQQALSDYDKAIRLDPGNSYSYLNRALAYRQLGDVERAIGDFGEAIRLRPEDPYAYLHRGLIFLDTGKLDEAVADFTRAHDLEPKDAWPLANRGIAYAWKNERTRAERDFQAVRAIDPSNPVLLRGEALLSIQAGDMSTAADRLAAALSREPDNVWALGMRARAYWELGEFEKARADQRKMLQLAKGARIVRVANE